MSAHEISVFVAGVLVCAGTEGTGAGRVDVVQFRFLIETMVDLDKSLRKRGSRLLVVRGNPVALMKVVR